MDEDGRVIGNANENPVLHVQFRDVMIKTYAANTIAENIYNMVNDKGKSEIIFDGIIGHKKNRNAVSKVDRYVTVNDKKFP